MNAPFYLHLNYEDKEHELPARFERWGHIHRFAVMLDEVTYFFEPDEEGNYRVVADKMDALPKSVGLLKAVAEKLAELDAQ